MDVRVEFFLLCSEHSFRRSSLNIFSTYVFVFVRRRRDNNKELSERVFYERKKRLRCSRRRRVLLLLNRARCTPSSRVLFKRIDITSTLRGEMSSRLSRPIQTIIQRARKRDTKTRARVLKTSFLTRRRRRTQRERERENKTHAAVILPTILFVSQRGNSFVIFL